MWGLFFSQYKESLSNNQDFMESIDLPKPCLMESCSIDLPDHIVCLN